MKSDAVSAQEMPRDSKSSNDVSSALAAAEQRFVQRYPKSLELHRAAVESLPGGNTRSLLHTAPFPIFMKSGKGYEVTDEDGHTCVKFPTELVLLYQ